MLPKRILCLHGDGTNAMVFAAQTRQLRCALELHGIDLVYTTGPFECEPGYGVSPFFDDCGPFYRWSPNDPRDFDGSIDAEDDISNSTIMEAGLTEMFEDLRYEYGDNVDDKSGRNTFAGILGFSSAAAVAAGILSVQQNNDEQDTFPTFPSISKDQCTQSIKVPTVSIVGKQDHWQSQVKLINTYIDSNLVTYLEFENGHKVPSKEAQVQEIVSAILNVIQKVEERS
ncbi:citrinin biosynthesis oxidoreductase CtnB [Colletotrichum navitas]|uniref:Citrinin biosynthesis oxidoreductase CtnB n=1 Tax=Colletotrichum navitas TaxID=681940 RepID=A0AAD8PJA2_9PEZI|nr:citrinin biosynthesis oxidoreductase CtnB [Colletotrichum navitas]KAK1565845.1 citrinin biosynthesis oxidoreductase CtnB [Colletotrichum navitas]